MQVLVMTLILWKESSFREWEEDNSLLEGGDRPGSETERGLGNMGYLTPGGWE